MIYELRTYEAVPGKMGALNERFSKYTVPLFQKHGIGTVGFWTNAIGTSGQLIYMLSFANMADRESKLEALRADPGRSVYQEAETKEPLITKSSNRILSLTPYSPVPQFEFDVVELRIYEAMPGKLQALHDRFENHAIALFKRHGVRAVAFWTEDVGTSNQLDWMLEYPTLGDREKAWDAFGADPQFQVAVRESERDGPLPVRTHNTILRRTAYSPR